MSQSPYALDFIPADCFLFQKLKTALKRKRFAAIDKRKIETEAAGGTKKRVSKVFRGLEKALA